LDDWARAAWKSPHAHLLTKLLAPMAWASVRVFYRVEYALAQLAWWCSRTPHVLVQLCWRIYHWGGWARSAAQWGYWRVAFPVLSLCSRISSGRRRILGVPRRRDPRGEGVAREANSARAELVDLVGSLGEEDVVVLPSADPSQLEMLLQLVPSLGLSSPLPTTL